MMKMKSLCWRKGIAPHASAREDGGAIVPVIGGDKCPRISSEWLELERLPRIREKHEEDEEEESCDEEDDD